MIKELRLHRRTLGPGESGSGVFFYGPMSYFTTDVILSQIQDRCLDLPVPKAGMGIIFKKSRKMNAGLDPA